MGVQGGCIRGMYTGMHRFYLIKLCFTACLHRLWRFTACFTPFTPFTPFYLFYRMFSVLPRVLIFLLLPRVLCFTALFPRLFIDKHAVPKSVVALFYTAFTPFRLFHVLCFTPFSQLSAPFYTEVDQNTAKHRH